MSEVKAPKANGFVSLNPAEITLPPETERGRANPHTPESVRKTAISIAEFGQKQAIGVYKNSDKGYTANFGFGRIAAVLMLREGFEYDGKKYHIPDLRIDAKVQVVDPLNAFIATIVENNDREDTNPVDDALNQNILRTRYNYTNAQIAATYHYPNPGKVYQLERILTLEQEYKDAIVCGELSFAAAVELASIKPEERAEALNVAAAGGKKVTAAALIGYMREKGIDLEAEEAARQLAMPTITAPTQAEVDLSAALSTTPGGAPNPGAPATNPAGTPRKARGASQSKLRLSSGTIVKGVEAFMDDENTSDALKTLLADLKKWMNGNLKDETVLKKLQAAMPNK